MLVNDCFQVLVDYVPCFQEGSRILNTYIIAKNSTIVLIVQLPRRSIWLDESGVVFE